MGSIHSIRIKALQLLARPCASGFRSPVARIPFSADDSQKATAVNWSPICPSYPLDSLTGGRGMHPGSELDIPAMQRGKPWGAGIACVLLLNACMSADPTQSKQLPSDSEPSQSGTSIERDRPSPQDIVIAWDERAETFRASALSATLHNNTDKPLTVRLSAESFDPHGDVLVRALGEHTLQARSTKPVDLRLDRIAVQTAGVSSGLRLVAQLEIEAPRTIATSDVVIETLSRVVAATTVHVTFDADFREATIRSIAAQAAANAPAYIDDDAPRPTAMRVFDEASSAMREVDMVAARKASQKPIVSFVDLPVDALSGSSFFALPSAVQGAVP